MLHVFLNFNDQNFPTSLKFLSSVNLTFISFPYFLFTAFTVERCDPVQRRINNLTRKKGTENLEEYIEQSNSSDDFGRARREIVVKRSIEMDERTTKYAFDVTFILTTADVVHSLRQTQLCLSGSLSTTIQILIKPM